MNREEALAGIKNNAPGKTNDAWRLNHYWKSKGFLEGHKQGDKNGYVRGVRDAANIADHVLDAIKKDTGYIDNFQGESVTTVRNKILLLLSPKEGG